MEEVYKEINGFEKYQVSNLGNVKTKKTGRILKPSLNKKDGYYRVVLMNENSKRFNLLVSRLVGLAFLENPDSKPKVDHIDTIKTNNNLSNLRWADSIEQGRNRNKWGNCSSQYKGVSFHKLTNKWQSSIRINYKLIHLGTFQNEHDAAQKYNDYIINNNLTEFFILNNINE